MIIVRAPFRISFLGGGSDIESYYRYNGGEVISVAINKYIYLTAHEMFNTPYSFLKYSKYEKVKSSEEIAHPIIKAVFRRYGLSSIDFNSIGDLPAGTGMGSSSSFTVALIKLASEYLGLSLTQSEIAEVACDIEINELQSPIGKQDQYGSAYGGLKSISFGTSGEVNVEQMRLPLDTLDSLNNNLFLLYTGITRSASKVLQVQVKSMESKNKRQILDSLVRLTQGLKNELRQGRIDSFGDYLNEGWELKRSITDEISNNEIDFLYKKGLASGADGGKLLGAGAGGFILFHVPKENHNKFKNEMNDFEFLDFSFDFGGVQTIFR